MLLFIIPTFAKMFTDFGGDLPLPTKVVLILSDFLRSKWWLLAGGIVAGTIAFKRFYVTEFGKLRVDAFVLKIPVLGQVIRKAAIARFTRTLGTLLASGVTILDGLEITARTSGNRVIHDAIMNSRSSIAGGESISEPLRVSGVFPPMVTQMINVGEETGDLDGMLTKIADFYDEEVDAAVESLLKAMEPLMIVFLGFAVGFIVISLFMPLVSLITGLSSLTIRFT